MTPQDSPDLKALCRELAVRIENVPALRAALGDRPAMFRVFIQNPAEQTGLGDPWHGRVSYRLGVKLLFVDTDRNLQELGYMMLLTDLMDSLLERSCYVLALQLVEGLQIRELRKHPPVPLPIRELTAQDREALEVPF